MRKKVSTPRSEKQIATLDYGHDLFLIRGVCGMLHNLNNRLHTEFTKPKELQVQMEAEAKLKYDRRMEELS